MRGCDNKMAQIEKRDITRVNMNLPTQMVTKVKEYADSLGLPVTQAYTVLINLALEQKDMVKLMPELLKGVSDLKELADNQKSSLIEDNSDI